MTEEPPFSQTQPAAAYEILGIMFIGLKLGNVIDWSWWWVLSPFWIVGGLQFFVAGYRAFKIARSG